MADSRFADPAQAQTRQCDAELRRGDVIVEVYRGILGDPRPCMPLVCKLGEARPARAYQRKFRRDEESVDKDQGKYGQQPENR